MRVRRTIRRFFCLVLLALRLTVPAVAEASGTLASQERGRSVIDAAWKALGGSEAVRSLAALEMRLAGRAFDEGQSRGPGVPYHERPVAMHVELDTRSLASRREVETVTIGGLVDNPVFVLRDAESGWWWNRRSNEWGFLSPLETSILRGPPLSIRCDWFRLSSCARRSATQPESGSSPRIPGPPW